LEDVHNRDLTRRDLALPVCFGHASAYFPRGERGDRTLFTHPLSLTLIAFVITALPAWALTKHIGKNRESLYGMQRRFLSEQSSSGLSM